MMRIFVLAFILSGVSVFSQLIKQNETTIFSFKTKSGKTAVLCKDENEKYIVYRFGKGRKIELEYPAELDNSSWEKFTYSYYFRGGGKMNAGEDLNYVSFENKGFTYKIYSEYYAEDESVYNGILVTDANGKETDVKGINGTADGSLVELRYNEKIRRDQ